jgi:NUDIX domain
VTSFIVIVILLTREFGDGRAEVLDVVSASSPDILAASKFSPRPIDSIHKEGLPHRGSWVYAIDGQGRVLLLWRSASMRTCPQTWSLLGEHCIAGESFFSAAARGVEEEAPFLESPPIRAVGLPFFFQTTYAGNGVNGSERADNQWTRTFVAVASSSVDDFEGPEVVKKLSRSENTQVRGMSLAEVALNANNSGGDMSFTCNENVRTWMRRTVPVVVRVLREQWPALYREKIARDWSAAAAAGSFVCCLAAEDRKQKAEQIVLERCGVACTQEQVTDLQRSV